MKQQTLLSLLVTTGLLLSACDDSGSDATNNNIAYKEGRSTGAITSLDTTQNSLYQNGIRYDISQAKLYRDGQLINDTSAYRVGEITTITGQQRLDDKPEGIADRVDFETTLAGVITAPPTDKTVEVLKQPVKLTNATVLHDVNALTALQMGQVVSISGAPDANGILNASSLELEQAQFTANVSEQMIQGVISKHNAAAQSFNLGQLEVDYRNASLNQAIRDGLSVRVYSQRPLNNGQLQADRIRLQQDTTAYNDDNHNNDVEVELEGFITRFDSPENFSIGNQAISTTPNTRYEYGNAANLQLNAAVEVEGYVDAAGVLQAYEIDIRQGQSADAIKLEGFISAVDSASQTIDLLGQTLLVDSRSILLDEQADRKRSIAFSTLRPQDYVEAKASALSNGTFRVQKLERENPYDTDDDHNDGRDDDGHDDDHFDHDETGHEGLEIEGLVSSFDAAAGTMVVLGTTIDTDAQTLFEGQNDQRLTRQAFFAALTPQTRVEVEGRLRSNNNQRLLAYEVSIETDDD